MAMYETLAAQFFQFQRVHFEFQDLVICTISGEIVFSTDTANLYAADCQAILNAWLHNKQELHLQEIRYSVLKTDIYQFAALNPVLRRGIVGSIDKEHNYAIGLVETEKNPDNSLLLSSIELNKLMWNTR